MLRLTFEVNLFVGVPATTIGLPELLRDSLRESRTDCLFDELHLHLLSVWNIPLPIHHPCVTNRIKVANECSPLDRKGDLSIWG